MMQEILLQPPTCLAYHDENEVHVEDRAGEGGEGFDPGAMEDEAVLSQKR